MTDPSQPTRNSPRSMAAAAMSSGASDLTVVEGGVALADTTFTWVVRLFTALAVLVLFLMGIVIAGQAMPAIHHFGLGFIWGQDWDVPNNIFGALPYIFGTLVSSAIAVLLALPIGTAVAIITSEDFLPDWVRTPIGFTVELLAAIPSVIVGLWGIFVLIPIIQPLGAWLHSVLGWVPLFNTEPSGPGMYVAGVILAIMIIPTIASITREVLRAVPKDLRSASMALGSTRWETIFGVMLPAASSGMIGANLLALGRALGETMAVTMVIGNSPQISSSLFDLASSIPAVLANEFAEAQDGLHISSLMYLALLLFVITLLVNVAAVLLVQVLGQKSS
ncbi:phosphate ABC transporter permease [Neosynechococcus sphagnicola sy1]|uniref:Phosphate transport system permease protein n=1 Tax=Neosynechococcus sphagnicola sy1 TaxID=1497020 RepID=A0A098TJA8_9CYAN|nr:phosphate ABC transporter permease subunit PstC [Neosynechococcus sphagnicola]KGF72179.1 phosphate ABC transporter permease [Neosynechococcus sphagnicola sy1]